MPNTTDILLDAETFAPQVVNGDFVIGDATNQNQALLLLLGKNDAKRTPTRCVGANSFTDDEDKTNMLREIRKEYVRDGMKIDTMQILPSGKYDVKAHYEDANS